MEKKDIERNIFGFLARWLAPSLLKLLKATCTINSSGVEYLEKLREEDQNFILTAWHGQIMPVLFYVGPVGFYTFVSPHRDGEYIARVFKGMGHHSLRTSLRDPRLSTLAKALRLTRGGESLAITPDGPLGPRCRVKNGVIKLSEKAEIPILPIAGLVRRAKYFSSWDNFCLPYPFAEINIEFGQPFYFWKENSSLEKKQQKLEKKMNRLTDSCADNLELDKNPMSPAEEDEN